MTYKIKTVLLAATLTLAASAATSVQAAKKLTAPDPDWTGGVVTCRVLQYILENELDYKVKTVTMPSGPGTREGIRNGDLDFACESWPSYDSSKEKYVTKFGGDGSVAYLGTTGIVGVSGYFVPRYMVEGDSARGIKASAPNLKAHTDLNNLKDLFKTLESGDKGNLIGCPVAAWECDDQKRLDMLGINFKAQALGSETAHWAEMKAKYNRGEPFLAYAWAPHWIHAELDMVQVSLPPHSDKGWPATGWAEDVTYNYGSPNLAKEHPDAYHVISHQNLTNNQQAAMIFQVDVKKRDLDEVVEEWMAANEAVWRPWLP